MATRKLTGPAHELKAFSRVELKPGEAKTVEFKLDRSAFEYWSPQQSSGPLIRAPSKSGSAHHRATSASRRPSNPCIDSRTRTASDKLGAKMPRQVHYNAAENIPAETAKDPYLRPASSTAPPRRAFHLEHLLGDLLPPLAPPVPRMARSMLLRLFGAKMGPHCHFYSSSRVWAPWNLICADQVTAGDGAESTTPHRSASARTRSFRRTPTSAAPPTTLTIQPFRFSPTKWKSALTRGSVRGPVSLPESTSAKAQCSD